MNNEKNMDIKNSIRVEIDVENDVSIVWSLWTVPEHICEWNRASDEWHCPQAEIDLRDGGRFCYRMEAKDRSAGFDFTGTFGSIEPYRKISYTLDDARAVEIGFDKIGEQTKVTQVFEPDSEYSVDIQKEGWQAILNNFKMYAESHN